jgi:hypothetical protein
MLFTIEFFRLREEDDAHATLDRIRSAPPEAGKDKAKIALRDIEHAAEARWACGF